MYNSKYMRLKIIHQYIEGDILIWGMHYVNSISKAEIANVFVANDTNGNCYMDFINKRKTLCGCLQDRYKG